jgi:O-antigen/teichoic acid export membrane protein
VSSTLPSEISKAQRRRRRILRGIGATALNPLANAAIQLGTVPFLLQAWGAAKYGDWLLLSAIPSYLALTNLGFGDASGSDMTVRVAKDDRTGALETFQSSWVLLGISSLVALVIALSFAWWIPWQRWMHLSSLSNAHASAVMFTFAAYIIVSQQNGILESGYRCDGNFALGTSLSTVLRLTEAVLATAVGVATGSLLYTALTYFVVKALGTLGYASLLRRKSPWLRLGVRFASLGRVKALSGPAIGFMAMPLGSAITIQGFTVLIGILEGPIAVASFATLRTMTRLNFQLTTVIAWTLWPELSSAFGANDIPLARRLHRRAYQGGLMLSLSACAFLWLAGPQIYRAWIRHAVPFDTTCFHVLLLVTLANSLWFTTSVVPMSTNAHQRLALLFVAGSCLSLVVAWFLVRASGISGAAWALLLVDVGMVFLVLRTSLAQLQDTALGFFSAVFTFRTPWSLQRLRSEA